MGHRSQGNEWRTVGGPHALVFLEANQPRQSLVDPGIKHGFEPDYGFETGRRARRRPAPEGSQGRGARPRMSWGCGARSGPSTFFMTTAVTTPDRTQSRASAPAIHFDQ